MSKGFIDVQNKRFIKHGNIENFKNLLRLKCNKEHYRCEICKNNCSDEFKIHHISYKYIEKENLKNLILLCPSCYEELYKRLNSIGGNKNCKTCNNCKYSERMNLGKDGIVLYCNHYKTTCNGLCDNFEKGEFKRSSYVMMSKMTRVQVEKLKKRIRGENNS